MLAFWAGGATSFGNTPPPAEETAVPNVKIVLGRKKYKTVEQQLHEIRARAREQEQEIEHKIAKAEHGREVAQKQLALARLEEKRKAVIERAIALEAQAQEQIRVLLLERERLIRWLIDEEESLIVIYSLPFMN